MTMVQFMSEEARRYYMGGKRVMLDGVPCRLAAWHGQKTGKATIAKLVATGCPIDGLPEASRFRFEPVEGARLTDGKPSARGNFTYRSRFAHKSAWWKPCSISLAPMYGMAYGSLTGETSEERSAKRAWSNGDAEPLRQWLSETASERRQTWAAIDASRAIAACARLLGALPSMPVEAVPEPVSEPVPAMPEPVRIPSEPMPVNPVELAAFILSRCRDVDSVRLPVMDDTMSSSLTAKQFRKVREGMKWTQRQMADWGGVTERTIIRFENGNQPVPRIWKLALEGLVHSE